MEDYPSILLSKREFEFQLVETEKLIQPFGGRKWFRPGSGWFTSGIIAAVAVVTDHRFVKLRTGARYHPARRIVLKRRTGFILDNGSTVGIMPLASRARLSNYR